MTLKTILEATRGKCQRLKGASRNFFYLALAASIPLPASAQGLQRAKGFLELIYSELTTLIPILATISLALAFMGYMFKMIQKDTFIKWLVGIIGLGSCAQIVAMLYT